MSTLVCGSPFNFFATYAFEVEGSVQVLICLMGKSRETFFGLSSMCVCACQFEVGSLCGMKLPSMLQLSEPATSLGLGGEVCSVLPDGVPPVLTQLRPSSSGG